MADDEGFPPKSANETDEQRPVGSAPADASGSAALLHAHLQAMQAIQSGFFGHGPGGIGPTSPFGPTNPFGQVGPMGSIGQMGPMGHATGILFQNASPSVSASNLAGRGGWASHR